MSYPRTYLRLNLSELDIPLPGERRADHMTAAWYADRVGLAAQEKATPEWRAYVSWVVPPLTLGLVGWWAFVGQPSFVSVAAVTIVAVGVILMTLKWSLGRVPGKRYAWRVMARHLIRELHESTPHELQPDCGDYSCQYGHKQAQQRKSLRHS